MKKITRNFMNWTKSIAILALVLMPTIGQASHTRGSTLYWEKHPSISNAIILYGTASTARSTRWATGSYTGLGTLNFTTSVTIEYFNGSGTTNTSQVGTQFAPSSLVFLSNTIEDYTTRKLVHYDANGNLVDGAIVKFTSGTTWPQEVDFVYACCRVSNISASGTESNLGTEINLSGGNSSPVAATPAVIQVPSSLIGSTWTYQLTASDPDNDGVKFRLGTPSEFGGTWVRTDYAAPVGLSISGSGLITWQIPSGTSSSALAALGYIIEDYTPSDPNQTVKSSASYDIILRLVNTTTNQPPVIVSAPSTTQYYPYLVGAGSSYNFQIDVEDVYNSSTNTLPGSGNHVTINEISGIPNLTYTVTTQSNEKSVINATFTPTVAQTGKSYTAVFEINDGNLTTYQNVSIQVRNNPNPSIADIDFTGDGCSSLIFASTDFSSVFSDPDSDPMELIRIDALPSSGSLTFKGVSVQVNDEIIASEISYLQYFNSTPGVYSFDWSAKDNQGYWSQTTETATINIEGISTTVAPLTASGTDVTPAVIDNAATVISSSTFTTASIEITNNLTTGDVLASGSGTLPSGATDSYANGVLTLSGTAMTASELQTWFRGVTFQSSSSSQKRTFTFTAGATTTGCNSLSSDRILNNTLPVISSLSDQSTCLTGSTTSQSFTVSDVEDTDPNVLTVSVSTSNPSVVALSDISYSVSNGTGSIAVTNAQSFGSSVITVTVTDQGGATSSSSFVWRNTVVDGIDASSGSTFIPYASTATLIDNALLVTSTNTFTNPKVSVSANFQSGDALSLSSSYSLPSGSSSYNSTTGELTITGTYSASQLQAMFRAVQFSTSSSNENARTIQFDGGSSSGSSACYVGVTTKEVTLNQTPTISGPTSITSCAGGSAINETITVGDANDGTGGVSLSASASSNTAVLPTSAISFSGTGAARTMTITVPSGASAGTTNLTIEVSDRFGKTATVVVPFTLSTFGYTSITPPTDITQNIDLGECDAHVHLADPTVIGGTCYTWTNDEPAHFPVGTTTVTWQMLDNSGTVRATVTQDVTIVDNVAPTLVTQNVTKTITNTSGITVPASDFIASWSDNCSSTYTVVTPDFNFTCSDVGTQTVNITIADASGTQTTETADITIVNGLTSELTITNSLCTATPMYWATWNNVTSTSGTGTFAGLGVTVDVTHSQGGLSTTSVMFGHSTFPSTYNVPNTTTLRNDLAGTFTFCFSQPIENPQIAFSSIGNPSTPVPITTSVPYQVVWNGQAVNYSSNTSFTGNEGYTIISFPGTHECITLTYSADETYANLAFGFENFNCDNPTVCAGDPITLTASGGSGYTWSPSASLSASNTASVVATPSATTTYSVIDPNNACSVPQTVTINVPVPTAPTATSPQAYCPGSTIGDLVATAPTGMGVLWYTTSTGGTALPSSTVLVDGTTYYAETNDLTCGPSTTRTPVVFNETAALAQTSPGIASVVRGFPAAVDNQLVVNETNNISDAIVFISSGFVSGDILDYPGTLPAGVNKSYNSTTGVLTFSGTMTPSELETIFRGVTMNTTSMNGQNREVTFNIGSALPNSANGHFYEFVTSPGISWTSAKTAAQSLTYYGLQGYLVTVTSADENSFVFSKLNGQGWMGASDATTEDQWYWVTGPESGQQFWSGRGSSGTSFGGRYNNWNLGEPNDYGSGEDYAHFRTDGTWNDFPVSTASINGYVVEYGGSSGDPCVALSTSKLVDVTISIPPTLTTTSPVIQNLSTVAKVEGTIVSDGNAAITERGILIGTTSNLSTSNASKSINSSTSTGSYTETITSLVPSTFYYARSYAINSAGTGYGNEISFYTAPIDVAAITSTNYNSTVGYDVICYGTSTTLTATTPDGVVQWYDDAGLTNLIGTGNSITVSPTATTTYYARNLNNGLYSDNTASLTVTVRPQLVAAVISGAETVCWNSRPNALTGVAATGGSSAADAAPGFSYQWEESTDGGTTWTAISGATNYATYQPGYLYQTTRYRLVATDLGTPSCASALISNEIEITVRDPFTPSVVSTNGTNNTFCDGGSINLSATPTTGGSGPAFYYQWQQSADSLNWTNIGPLLNNTTAYTATGITSDTHFRIIAFDQGTPACGSVFSTNTVKAVMQTPVTEGDISGAQHICAQTAPTAAIANVTAGTGRGTISYRWEESTDGGTTWTTIAGATSDSYQPGVLAVTTKYRRFTVSTLNGFDCESTSPTSEVEITVDQLPIATMTTTTDVTCVNAAYTLSGVNAQYGTVTWSHNGAGSLTGTSTLTPTYTPSTADAGNTVTITMTVTGTTICLSTTETASIDLQVDALPVAVAGGTATICSNATHTVSGASSANGTIAWTHDGNGVLTDVNSLTPTYAPTAADAGNAVTLTMTVSSDNQCAGETAVATYTVNVDPLPVAIAGGSDIICSEATAVVSGASAANGTILWTHNGSGTISDATTLTPSYTADAADAGSTVTLTMTVSSTNTCTPQTATATYAVTVRPDFVPATFVAQDQDLCYLTSADVITATAATGGTGPYSYQWQMSTDSATWTNVSGATSLTYQPVGILNATQYYRILSTDDGSPGCGTSMAGEDDVKILVRDPLTPPVVSNITVCNSTSTTITPIGARGGRGEFEYQWQESANGSTGWANVGVSSLDSTYTTPTLTTGTTYYRVIARDKDKGSLLSCGSTFSSAMKVTIGATATSGAIAGDETICTGDVAASITSTTDGTGSGTISYQWEESTDGGTTWTTIAGATSNTFSPGILTQTTSYRRTTVATLNGVPCESAVTTAVTKTVHQLPTFTAAPSNMTVNTDAGLPTAAVSYTATATGPTAVTLTYAITGATTASGSGTGSGEPFNIGTSTVVISATTNCGVTTTTFDVEVIDNENPTITAGADESHNTTVATTGCAMPLTVVSPVAADNAPGVAVSYVLTGATTGSGTSIANVSFNVGTTTITWTATDASGNTATDVQDIIVVDAVAPAIAGMPADMTLNADAGLCTTTATWTVPTSIDECGIASFTADAASGDVFTVGTTTVTYTAVDNNGNTTTASFDVTVVDNQLPVIAGTPADITLVSDANACGATATWTAPTSSDNCGIASFVSTHASGDFFAVGTTTVTYTATDVNGNIETGSFDVTVSDLDPVIAGVPANISVGNDAGNCSAVVTWTAPTVSDNCSGVTMVSTHNSGDTFPEGTTTVTYTATDNNGNTTTASFDITVSDTEDPIFVSAPADMTVSTSATTCDAIVTWTSPVVSDNCTSAPTVTSTHASGDTFAKGTTTVTYTVTDAEGNDETHSFDVTVEDNTAPIITAVTDITVDVDAASCESANPGVVTPSATDNCDATVTVTGVRSDALALNAPYPLGTTTITWSASDSEGNAATSLTQDVTVLDTIAPYVTQQLADTLYVDENSCVFYLEAWRDSIQFSDNCGGVATLTSARPANLFLNKGTHVINYTLTDVDGNTRVYNHAVEIMDTIPPVLLNMPADLTVNASATSCGAIVTWTPPTPSDNCVSFVMTGTAKSGDYFNVGTTTVVYSLVDAEGYTVKDSFDITVVDATAPVIASSNATVVLDASGAATIALSDVLASAITDNCGLASSSVDVTSFGCADLGTNTVTITATDIHGNTSTATATVTVVDQAAPTVVAQNITIYLDTTGAASITVADVHDSSSDNCGVSATTIDVSSFGCSDLGANTVVVTSTDASGNAGTATATVTVLDTISPSLSVPAAGYTAYASANSCGATVTFTGITGADNCSAPTITYDMVSGATYSVGTTTVTATATDGSGNTTTATFDVTVLDTISPSIVNVPSTVTIVPDVNSCNSTVSWSMPNTTDNCSATLTSSVASGSSFGLGTHQVVFTAVDPSGNNSYDTLTFTVTDMVDPTLDNVPADTILYSSANTCDVMYAWPSIIGSDNCSVVTVSTSVASGSMFSVGVTTVNVTGTDAAGNTVIGSFDVTVVDTISPIWVFVPANINSGNCNSAVTYTLPTASDNCSSVTVAQVAGLPSGSTFPSGTTTNTFVATDASGNTSTVSFDVVINTTSISYAPPVSSLCENDAAVDLTDTAYALTFSGNGVSGSMFDPSDAGVGVHTLQYTFVDSLGCTITGNFSIAVNQLPTIPTIVRLSSTMLTVNNIYPSYQWYRNGVKINGATSRTYTVTQAGEYSVKVGNGNCYVFSDAFGFGIGIDEVEKGSYIVYPNPSHGQFKIVHGFDTDNMTIQVVNMLGQVIYQSLENESNITIDLSDVAQGSYILIMRNQETEVRQPLKIQR